MPRKDRKQEIMAYRRASNVRAWLRQSRHTERQRFSEGRVQSRISDYLL